MTRFFKPRLFHSLLFAALTATLFVSGSEKLYAAGEESVTLTQEEVRLKTFALIAAAVAFGFAAIGAGIAISNVGAAAIGAIGEKPELFGRTLIFVSLAEGLLIIGFAFGMLLIFL